MEAKDIKSVEDVVKAAGYGHISMSADRDVNRPACDFTKQAIKEGRVKRCADQSPVELDPESPELFNLAIGIRPAAGR